MLTARANHRMLSFLLRKTEVVSAGRALLINVCLSVTEFTFHKIEALAEFTRKFCKFLIFLLPFVNIF